MLNVNCYRQRGNTCAIACMLMVLEYYQMIPKASWLYEKKYYKNYRSYYMEGTPLSAIAWHFAKNGLDVEIVHSEKELFKNNGFMSESLFEITKKEYQEFLELAKGKGAVVSNGVNIDINFLKEKLMEERFAILAGQLGKILHTILLIGYEEDKFVVCDPLDKEWNFKTNKEISDFMNTSIGKWCVIVKK